MRPVSTERVHAIALLKRLHPVCTVWGKGGGGGGVWGDLGVGPGDRFFFVFFLVQHLLT